MNEKTNDKIAYFGDPGSFSHIAAEKYFGDDAQVKECATFRDVFEAVTNESCAFGVVPIENTLTSSLYENYDHLSDYAVCVVGEIYVKTEHALLVAHADTEVTTVLSHPKALEQCSGYLEARGELRAKNVPSTAHAAATVARQPEAQLAAIAHPSAAVRYGLYVRQRHLENDPLNYTRFFVIGRHMQDKTTCDKATVRVVLKHHVGSLSRLLEYLREYNVNLTKIESRPIVGRPFEYQFYLDMHHTPSTDINAVINGALDYSLEINLLGAYTSSKPSFETIHA